METATDRLISFFLDSSLRRYESCSPMLSGTLTLSEKHTHQTRTGWVKRPGLPLNHVHFW